MNKLDLPGRWTWWAAAVAGFVAGATGWLALRERDSSAAASRPRLWAVRGRVSRLAGPGAVRVRHLGGGIVELVGRIEDPELARTLLDEAARVEGVKVVLDRLWAVDRPVPERSESDD